ncbi:MAG: PmeII family type II restriction endonuclease [Bacteroidales bacterium]|nr:PmeII family type II restriction endonuclease [Bacteroidales bacterium]
MFRDNGWKSGIVGVDLEFDKDNTRYIVNIKSGPNWGNSSQISKMISDFKTAQRTLRTSNSNLSIVAVNGCCYGRNNNPDKGYYYKYCGQKFWEFISGKSTLYTEIIEPLSHKAKEKNDEFLESYYNMINKFTIEFGNSFCNQKGAIKWEELVKFNSSSK